MSKNQRIGEGGVRAVRRNNLLMDSSAMATAESIHAAITRDPTGGARVVPVGAYARVGRNNPCPCGSGTKFKKCCGL